MIRLTLLVLLLLSLAGTATGQSVTGSVTEAPAGAPIGDVVVQNIHTEASVITGPDGRFTIAAAPGQLVEFRRPGYKTARVRIGTVAVPYYRIILEVGVHELDEVAVRSRAGDFKHDSMRYRELFKKQLEAPVVTGWRAFQSPFSALSRSNRQLIHFREEYAWLEHQKYVDYTFNEKLVATLTGLTGDSAQRYMRQYRPSYEMLRSMQEYDYFNYVKRTAAIWRQRQRLGPSNSRGGGG